MSKICTDLKQSRKLISLGLDKNTADMHYFSDGYNPTKLDVGYSAENAKFYRGTKNKYIPAWSLTALLELMPDYNITRNSFYNKVVLWSQGGNSGECNAVIDAAFEMVCWLLENGYIKKVKK